MKVVVVGASGTIGAAVCAALREAHDVVGVSRSSSPALDLADLSSMEKFFLAVEDIDAVVCCAANTPLARLSDLDDPAFADLVGAKLFGQVSLARVAARHLGQGGSVTLTSGRFDGPVPGSAPGALVNSGLEGFVRAAADELPHGIRLNVVSPGWVAGSDAASGEGGTPVEVVAQAFVTAVEGSMRGQVISPR